MAFSDKNGSGRALKNRSAATQICERRTSRTMPAKDKKKVAATAKVARVPKRAPVPEPEPSSSEEESEDEQDEQEGSDSEGDEESEEELPERPRQRRREGDM